MASAKIPAEIAERILKSWREETPKYRQKYYAAAPYVFAMHELNSMQDSYGQDSARSIINYFLYNATIWRGEEARKIKAELKEMIK